MGFGVKAISLALLAGCAQPVVQPGVPAPQVVPQYNYVHTGKATRAQWERGTKTIDIDCDGKPETIGSTSENYIIANKGLEYIVLGQRADSSETQIPGFRFVQEPDGIKLVSMVGYGTFMLYRNNFSYSCPKIAKNQ